MKRATSLLLCLVCVLSLSAQQVDRAIRKGNEAYAKGDAASAIANYEKARGDRRGSFNLGNAYYRQDSVRDAQNAFEAASSLAKDPKEQSRAFHNLGNSWLKQQKWQEAVNAYKQALKREPNDDDTRYNLAYAQKKLAQEQKDDKNKDKDKDKEDQKDQEQKQPEQGDQKDPKQQQKPGQMDKQDAERMLDAMQQEEKNTQEKAREKMKVRVKKPIDKDW
jgi:Ca-activated chloride channel homolog